MSIFAVSDGEKRGGRSKMDAKMGAARDVSQDIPYSGRLGNRAAGAKSLRCLQWGLQHRRVSCAIFCSCLLCLEEDFGHFTLSGSLSFTTQFLCSNSSWRKVTEIIDFSSSWRKIENRFLFLTWRHPIVVSPLFYELAHNNCCAFSLSSFEHPFSDSAIRRGETDVSGGDYIFGRCRHLCYLSHRVRISCFLVLHSGMGMWFPAHNRKIRSAYFWLGSKNVRLCLFLSGDHRTFIPPRSYEKWERMATTHMFPDFVCAFFTFMDRVHRRGAQERNSLCVVVSQTAQLHNAR